jgi:hypothetical protein
MKVKVFVMSVASICFCGSSACLNEFEVWHFFMVTYIYSSRQLCISVFQYSAPILL